MFSKPILSLVVLFAACGTYLTSNDGASSAVSPIDIGNDQIVSTAVAIGTDSSGHTSYSLALQIPAVTRSVRFATTPDTTFTAAATLVEGSTDAHLFEVVTAGSRVITLNEDCTLNNDSAICTIVEKYPTTTVSTVTTVIPCAYPCVTGVTTFSPTPRNGAGRVITASGAFGLVVVGAGMLLA